jgi:hypothetical protein
MSSNFQRLLTAQLKRLNSDSLFWAFPAGLGFAWILWPALDYEWKMELGLAPDPEAVINRVYEQKLARMKAVQMAKTGGTSVSSSALAAAAVEKDDDDEEEEEAVAEPEEEKEEEAAAEGDDDVPAMEDGDDEEEEEEEEEESASIKIKPLYLPTKADKLGLDDIWDNFTIKAVNMSEDDDDGT